MPHITNSPSASRETGDEHNPLDSSCLWRSDKSGQSLSLSSNLWQGLLFQMLLDLGLSPPSFHDEPLCGVWYLMGTWDETMTWTTISFQICQRPKQNWHSDCNKEDLGSSYWVSYISDHHFCTLAFNPIISCFSLMSESISNYKDVSLVHWWGRYTSHKHTAALLAA